MSRFLHATAFVLLLFLPVAGAATPKATETQGKHPETNNCVVIDDGNGLACAGAAPDVAGTARTWIEERVAALRAEPEMSEDDEKLLEEFEAYLSGPDKVITIKRLPH
ncbi:MAG: hypothetical protein VR75_03110 [Hyphomonadaceae bacterium BRH_c29]|nr:MAG: hypothetical protein VR75_03110 [Hyphomonadaceae bacterium BRH_c29]